MSDGPEDAALAALRDQEIEIPSWGFGASGTRFAKLPVPGQARTLDERVADAALVREYTGARLRLSLHLPWDVPEDWRGLAATLRDADLQPGTINPNLFEDPDYRLGSVANPDPRVRSKAIRHLLDAVAASREVGTRDMWVWLPDGTNAPGQSSFRVRNRAMLDALGETYARIGTLSAAADRVQAVRAGSTTPTWLTGDRRSAPVSCSEHAPRSPSTSATTRTA